MGKKNASLRGPETPLDITLDKAVDLLANRNKKSRNELDLNLHYNVFFCFKVLVHSNHPNLLIR